MLTPTQRGFLDTIFDLSKDCPADELRRQLRRLANNPPPEPDGADPPISERDFDDWWQEKIRSNPAEPTPFVGQSISPRQRRPPEDDYFPDRSRRPWPDL
jgi:hypothetical protein